MFIRKMSGFSMGRLSTNDSANSPYPGALIEVKASEGVETEADLLISLLKGVLYSIAALSQKDPDEVSIKEINKLEKRLDILFQAMATEKAVNSDDLLGLIISLLATSHSSNNLHLLAHLGKFINNFFEQAQNNQFVSLDMNGQAGFCLLQLNAALEFIVNNPLEEIEKVKQEKSSIIARLANQQLDENQTEHIQIQLQQVIELESELQTKLIGINPDIFCKKLEEELKKYKQAKTESDLLKGLLNGMLDSIHELSLKNPADLTKENLETLGTQIDVLNNHFNYVLYVAKQSIRIKGGSSANKNVELGANDPLYVAILLLACGRKYLSGGWSQLPYPWAGSVPNTEIQNRLKSFLPQILKFMEKFPQLAKEKGANFILASQASQGITMLAAAALYIANKPDQIARLLAENPSVLLLVKEIETLSTTTSLDFTSSFADDAESLAREQQLAKLGREHKEKALKLFVKLAKKQRKKIEIATLVQQLHEDFVKDLKSQDYDAQGIASITVPKQYITEQLSVFKAQLPDDFNNGVVLQIYKPGFIQGFPIQSMLEQQTHALCQAAKESPFELKVDETLIIENLNIVHALEKATQEAIDEVRNGLKKQGKEKSEMQMNQEETNQELSKLLNKKFEKLMHNALKHTINMLYMQYVTKFSDQPNVIAFKEFGKLLIHHALNNSEEQLIVNFNEETHTFSYGSCPKMYEGNYSDAATFQVTGSVNYVNQFANYFANFVTNKNKIDELLNFYMVCNEQKAPSQVDQPHLKGEHCNSLLTDSQKAYVREKLNSYPNGRYSKKILGEDFPYGIIKNDGQYFVIYEGYQKNKLLGAGTSAKVKLAQCMDNDKWFTLKVFSDERLAYKELQKLMKLNKTPQKEVFAKQGKPCGKIPGQMKHNILIEYVPGEELQQYIARNHHQLSTLDLIDIALGMCQALAKLHDTHFHCDIKLKNFVIDEKNKSIHIIDFGSVVERGLANTLLGFAIKGEIAGTEGHMTESIIHDLKRGATHTYYSESSEFFALACALEQLFLNCKYFKFLEIHKFLFKMKYGEVRHTNGGLGTSTVIPSTSVTEYIKDLKVVERFFKHLKTWVVIHLPKATHENSASSLIIQSYGMFRHSDLTFLKCKIEKLKQKRNKKKDILKVTMKGEELTQDIIELNHRINILQKMHDDLLNSSVLKQRAPSSCVGSIGSPVQEPQKMSNLSNIK